jgi:hypothetical protein
VAPRWIIVNSTEPIDDQILDLMNNVRCGLTSGGQAGIVGSYYLDGVLSCEQPASHQAAVYLDCSSALTAKESRDREWNDHLRIIVVV